MLLIRFQRASEFGVLPPDIRNCYHRQAVTGLSEEPKHIMACGGFWRGGDSKKRRVLCFVNWH
jgi:hypothetical protein